MTTISDMSSANPFEALSGKIHHASSGGGSLGHAANSLAVAMGAKQQVAAHAAMRDIDAHHATNLANHHAALQEHAAGRDHLRGMERDTHQHTLQVNARVSDSALKIGEMKAAGKQERKTIKARGQQERDTMVVGAHADAARAHQQAAADVSRIGAQSAAKIAETKTVGSQERSTYGYKARTDASVAPQPHVSPVAPTHTLSMPSAPTPTPAKKAAAKKAPAAPAAASASSVALPTVTTRTLQSKMKPVKKAASKVSRTPTMPTFQAP